MLILPSGLGCQVTDSHNPFAHDGVDPPGRPCGSFKRQVALFRRDVDGGIPLIRLHDLRHGHATTLLRQGTPVKVVSERLGHTDATTTLRVYQHVVPGMQSEAAEAFAALPS